MDLLPTFQLKPAHWFLLLEVSVQLFLAMRVISQRRAVGETLAWLMIIFFFPIVGPIFYLIIGELKLGHRRAQRVIELMKPVKQWLAELPGESEIQWANLGVECEPLALLAERSIGLPALPGNSVELLSDWEHVFDRLIQDIDASQRTCHLEFYIWHEGGRAAEVAAALVRARERGVVCRILVDAMGSRPFLRSAQAEQLREAGVQVASALAGGILRMPFVRFDIRLHRKIVVIDGEVAYTGSLNLVDPRFFKQNAGVGQWVDAMVRVEGPSVEALAITFLSDWYVETNADITELRLTGDAKPQPEKGECVVHVLPSGPAYASDSIEQILLMAIYAAREELVLTTPYFVPSESLRNALITAARRGVKVVLLVPAVVDSKLVRYASQAFKGELLQAGVRIAHFQGGLLHTKSVTADNEFCLFGSMNLDPRSFHLNFEISLAMYDKAFTTKLRELQQTYIDGSQLMDLETWQRRGMGHRMLESLARLAGPVL